MSSQQVDYAAVDFNGAAWRSSNSCNRSTIEEVFSDCNLPTPPGYTPLWGPGSIPDLWTDVCGFLKPADSDRYWKVRKHGAIAIPRKALGLRDQDRSSHHETWLHLDLVERWDWSQTRREELDLRVQLKERSTPYCYGHRRRDINEIISDTSFRTFSRGAAAPSPSEFVTSPRVLHLDTISCRRKKRESY